MGVQRMCRQATGLELPAPHGLKCWSALERYEVPGCGWAGTFKSGKKKASVWIPLISSAHLRVRPMGVHRSTRAPHGVCIARADDHNISNCPPRMRHQTALVHRPGAGARTQDLDAVGVGQCVQSESPIQTTGAGKGFDSPHMRCTPMWAFGTCGQTNKTKKITHTAFDHFAAPFPFY